jgi:hypothetical protein
MVGAAFESKVKDAEYASPGKKVALTGGATDVNWPANWNVTMSACALTLAPRITRTAGMHEIAMPLILVISIRFLLSVELDHVAVSQRILAPDVVSLEPRLAPHARVLEGASEVLVNEPRDIFHGLAATQDKRPVPVGWAARSLRVDAHNSQMAE